MEEHDESTDAGNEEAPASPPAAPPPPPEPAATASAAAAPDRSPDLRAAAPRLHKSPGLAAFLSFFPGLGHVYCGLYSRALMFFAAVAGSIHLIDSVNSPVFGLSLVFFWSFGAIDAYRQASLINLGLATDVGVAEGARTGKPGQETLVVGIVLFSLGFLELLSRLRIWDWDFLAEHAYLLLMAVGGWLIVAGLRRHKKAQQEAPASLPSDY